MNARQFFSNQSWWGKLIGIFLGYLIAGPVGSIFGLLVGNFFDRGLTQHFSHPYGDYYREKRKAVQQIFFKTTFLVMGYLAKSDGRVSEQEIKVAIGLMKEMQLKPAQQEEAKAFFNQGKKSDFHLIPALVSLSQACHNNQDLLKLFVDIQYRCAQADGLSTQKIQAMNAILKGLGFAPLHQQYRFYDDFNYHRSKQRRQSYSHSKQSGQAGVRQNSSSDRLARAYAMLEINPNDNHTEVKRAYRRLISRNHPDKLIAKGLPEAMIKMANEKTQQIRQAYEEICQSKGWPS